MIKNKRDLDFYIKADRIMAGLPAEATIMESIKTFLFQLVGIFTITEYLKCLRIAAYKQNVNPRRFSYMWFKCIIASIKYNKYGQRFGFTIGPNSCGYGLVIPHYGTIVINEGARIGNYAVIHTSTCIGGSDKVIGNSFYLSTGSQVMGKNISIGDNVTVASHSLVNKSFGDNVLLGGAPSQIIKKDYPSWCEREAKRYSTRIEQVEKLHSSIQ